MVNGGKGEERDHSNHRNAGFTEQLGMGMRYLFLMISNNLLSRCMLDHVYFLVKILSLYTHTHTHTHTHIGQFGTDPESY